MTASADMVDWDLAVCVGLAARRPRARGQPARPTPWSPSCARTPTRSTGLVREFTGLVRRRRHRARSWSSTGRAGSAPTPRASTCCSPRSSTSSPRRRGRRPGSAKAVGSRVTGAEVGGVLGFLGRQGARAVRPVPRRRRAGCCWSRPTSSTSSASSTPTPPTSGSGSACTRRPTACSSPRCRGCATTSAAQIARSSDAIEPTRLLDDGLQGTRRGGQGRRRRRQPARHARHARAARDHGPTSPA